MFVAVHELVYFKCMPLGDVRYVLVVICSFKSFSLCVITVHALCMFISSFQSNVYKNHSFDSHAQQGNKERLSKVL